MRFQLESFLYQISFFNLYTWESKKQICYFQNAVMKQE